MIKDGVLEKPRSTRRSAFTSGTTAVGTIGIMAGP